MGKLCPLSLFGAVMSIVFMKIVSMTNNVATIMSKVTFITDTTRFMPSNARI